MAPSAQTRPMTSFVQGFALGGGLAVAFGATNVFVLTQGLQRRHAMLAALTCASCDAALIAVGVLGGTAIIALHPWFPAAAKVAGAAFLSLYAWRAAVAAWRGRGDDARLRGLDATGRVASRRSVILSAMAFTWLNPHAYLDAFVLLGAVAAAYDGVSRVGFAAGACIASALWFVALAGAAARAHAIFRRPLAWRILDGSVAVTMAALAVILVVG